MLIVSEEVCKAVIDRKAAFTAVENVFGAMARGDAYNFPVIREAIGYADALYGFKSGFDKAGKALGVKSGGYWPGNAEKGLTNHQSTIFLFDPDTGQLAALVGGNYLTAVRTAASSSVSIAHLARKDSKVLGMVGAGHQAQFQLRSAAEQRDFEKVVAWNFHPDMLPALGKVAEELGLPFEAVEREEQNRTTMLTAAMASLATLAIVAALRTAQLLSRRLRELHVAARTDPLTGLGNRKALDVERTRFDPADPARHHVAVSVDMDRFKLVNDSYGHAFGDRVLRIVGDGLHRIAHRMDIDDHAAIRLGGDEFLLLLHDDQPLDTRAIRRELDALRTSLVSTPDGSLVNPSFSYGVIDAVGVTCLDDLVNEADFAVYEDKAHRRADAGSRPARI